MFHCVAKLLTLLSVLIHGGLGCCAHHDHCSVLNTTSPTVERQESQEILQCRCKFHAHCNADTTSENAGDDEPDHSSCPCGEGHEGCSDHCSWLTNSKVELPTDHGIVLPAAIADISSVGTSSAALIACSLADGPPLLSDAAGTLRAKSQVWRL